MFLRVLVFLCLVSSAVAVTKAVCQAFCASVNGGASYNNCAPWISFAKQSNLTCYNLCVHNCAVKYDGACLKDSTYKCCIPTLPAKKNEFKQSGCNVLYNNL